MFFNKIFKKRRVETMATIDEVRKAYNDLSDEDKKKFQQSLTDRVDESVGEQEEESGTEDTQTAKDRVDEAEGAELADEEKDGELEEGEGFSEAENGHEEAQDEAHEKAAEVNSDQDNAIKAINARLDRIEAIISSFAKQPKEADETTSDKLNKLASKFE